MATMRATGDRRAFLVEVDEVELRVLTEAAEGCPVESEVEAATNFGLDEIRAEVGEPRAMDGSRVRHRPVLRAAEVQVGGPARRG